MDLIGFMQAVVARLKEFLDQLQPEKTDKFCNDLRSQLYLIGEWIADQRSGTVLRNDRLKVKIKTTLRNLEKLCTWAQSDKGSQGKNRNTDSIQAHKASGAKLFPAPRLPNAATRSVSPAPDLLERSYPELYRSLSEGANTPKGMRNFVLFAPSNEKEVLIVRLAKVGGSHNPKATRNQISGTYPSRPASRNKNAKRANVVAEEIVVDTSYLQALYDVLKRHCICGRGHQERLSGERRINQRITAQNQQEIMTQAQSEEERKLDIHKTNQWITACINLRSANSITGSRFAFSALLLDHPHKHDTDPSCQWHDIEVNVFGPPTPYMLPLSSTSRHLSMTNDMGRIRFPDQKDPSGDPIEKIEHGLCGLIARREQSRLSLVIAQGKLLVDQACDDTSKYELTQPSIPLASVITPDRLSTKRRLILSYFLAEAVWRFYQSGWMMKEWTRNSVHFMFEQRQDESGVFVDRPFLNADFDPRQDDESDKYYRTHKFPKILALSIMLIEIELGICIEKFRDDSCYERGKPIVNADSITAKKILRDAPYTRLWRETHPEFKSIIDVCLFPSKFEKFRDDTVGQQRELHAHVVQPLWNLCKVSCGGNLEIGPVKVEKTEQPSPTSMTTTLAAVESDHAVTIPTTISYGAPTSLARELRLPLHQAVATLYDDKPFDDPRAQQLAKDYLRFISEFNMNFIEPLDRLHKIGDRPSYLRQPVKVAILDSGVRSKDSQIMGALDAKRILEQKSFIGGTCEDTYGHGTHVARFFLQVAPKAQVYIAKISEAKEIPADQLGNIAKAIEHAIKEWDVDIISMSLGLDQTHTEIAVAIKKAIRPEGQDQQRLVFAAASNGGVTKARAFPACERGIFCINASNGGGMDIGLLSPACVKEKSNFVTLGIQVPSKEKREGRSVDVYQSGTSFATPIAAGLAANILEFARYELKMGEYEKKWLYSFRGMNAVLKRFSAETSGYRLLCPWRPPEGSRLTRDYLKNEIEKVMVENAD